MAIALGSRNLPAGTFFYVMVEHWINSQWRRAGLTRYVKLSDRGTYPSLARPEVSADTTPQVRP